MMPYVWEGNPRSGITLAVRHTQWFVCPPTDSVDYEIEVSIPRKLHLRSVIHFTLHPTRVKSAEPSQWPGITQFLIYQVLDF